MFDFSVLITVEITILVFYFASYISLKKEIDDFPTSPIDPGKNQLKINNRKNKLKFLTIVSFFLFFSVLILYFLPSITTKIKEIDMTDFNQISFFDIGTFLLKFVPFKKGFFSDFNFTFSYITETILFSVMTILILGDDESPKPKTISIFIIIIFIFTFIWVNNFISLFLTNCIIKCFVFLSLIFNLFVYVEIPIIIYIIYYLIVEKNVKNKKNIKNKPFKDFL